MVGFRVGGVWFSWRRTEELQNKFWWLFFEQE